MIIHRQARLPYRSIMPCNISCKSLLPRIWPNIEDFYDTIGRASRQTFSIVIDLQIMLQIKDINEYRELRKWNAILHMTEQLTKIQCNQDRGKFAYIILTIISSCCVSKLLAAVGAPDTIFCHGSLER